MILAANQCNQKAPTVYTASEISDIDRITNPNSGDLAALVTPWSIDWWQFVQPYTGDETDFDSIPGGCRGAWIRSTVVYVVTAFGAVGDGVTDDTDAFQNVFDYVNSVGGGIVLVPPGTYLIDGPSMYSNTTLLGVGRGASILKQKDGSTDHKYCLLINDVDGSGATNVENIRIADIGFLGLVETLGFIEHNHLLAMNGVSSVIVERCDFTGFQSDGIYVGQGSINVSALVHNDNVVIRNCTFDGVNNDNRNAISVVDGDGITISTNTFQNCTRSNQPGAIDLEPDATTAIIKNILISQNILTGIGGNVAAIALTVLYSLTDPVANITITANSISDSNNGILAQVAGTTATSPDANILINDNNCFDLTGRPIVVLRCKGVRIVGNRFADTTSEALIGYEDNTGAFDCFDLSFDDNSFTRIGTTSGYGISFWTVTDVVLEHNRFTDCGASNGSFGVAIYFASTGTYHQECTNVSLTGNIIESPNAKTTYGIQKSADYTINGGASGGTAIRVCQQHLQSVSGNDFLTGTYLVDIPYEEGTWTPTIGGTAGNGPGSTYTAQIGYYKRVGKAVHFTCTVLINTFGGGIGGAVVVNGLPYTSQSVANDYQPCSLQVASLTMTAGYTQIVAAVYPGTTRVQIGQVGTGVGYAAIGSPQVTNGSQFILSGTYFTN